MSPVSMRHRDGQVVDGLRVKVPAFLDQSMDGKFFHRAPKVSAHDG
jgi:hypothetical protein